MVNQQVKRQGLEALSVPEDAIAVFKLVGATVGSYHQLTRHPTRETIYVNNEPRIEVRPPPTPFFEFRVWHYVAKTEAEAKELRAHPAFGRRLIELKEFKTGDELFTPIPTPASLAKENDELKRRIAELEAEAEAKSGTSTSSSTEAKASTGKDDASDASGSDASGSGEDDIPVYADATSLGDAADKLVESHGAQLDTLKSKSGRLSMASVRDFTGGNVGDPAKVFPNVSAFGS